MKYPPENFDELRMYFGRDYRLNDDITIHTPSVGDIIDYGEREYYSMVYSLVAIPSDVKSRLADMGIDYEEISDIELFFILTRPLTPKQTGILTGDLDLSKLDIHIDEEKGICLKSSATGIVITEQDYEKMVGYIRKIHNIVPKVEKAATKTVKRILIEEDRKSILKYEKEGYKSTLKPLISAMMRYPGFKYKSHELEQCSIYEFLDTVQGSQIYVNSIALLQGSYSGMVDCSKINKKEFNWLRGVND